MIFRIDMTIQSLILLTLTATRTGTSCIADHLQLALRTRDDVVSMVFLAVFDKNVCKSHAESEMKK